MKTLLILAAVVIVAVNLSFKPLHVKESSPLIPKDSSHLKRDGLMWVYSTPCSVQITGVGFELNGFPASLIGATFPVGCNNETNGTPPVPTGPYYMDVNILVQPIAPGQPAPAFTILVIDGGSSPSLGFISSGTYRLSNVIFSGGDMYLWIMPQTGITANTVDSLRNIVAQSKVSAKQ